MNAHEERRNALVPDGPAAGLPVGQAGLAGPEPAAGADLCPGWAAVHVLPGWARRGHQRSPRPGQPAAGGRGGADGAVPNNASVPVAAGRGRAAGHPRPPDAAADAAVLRSGPDGAGDRRSARGQHQDGVPVAAEGGGGLLRPRWASDSRTEQRTAPHTAPQPRTALRQDGRHLPERQPPVILHEQPWCLPRVSRGGRAAAADPR